MGIKDFWLVDEIREEEDLKLLEEEIEKESDTFSFERICGEKFVRRKTRFDEDWARQPDFFYEAS